MRRLMAVLLAAGILGGATPGVGQTPSASDRPHRRWEVSGTFGISSGNAAVAIGESMSNAGLNSTYPAGCFLGLCWRDQYSPWSVGGELTGTLALSYAVRPWWLLRFQHTTADFGTTHGFRAPSAALSLRQAVTSVSALTVVSPGALWVGAGPSLHRVTVGHTEDASGRSQRYKLGLTLHGGLSWPEGTLLFADFAVQHQLVGSVEIGPFTASDAETVMARTRVPFNYLTVRLGMGVRM